MGLKVYSSGRFITVSCRILYIILVRKNLPLPFSSIYLPAFLFLNTNNQNNKKVWQNKSKRTLHL